MANPAVIVAAVAVAAISAVFAIFVAMSEKPQKTSYGSGRRSNAPYQNYSPPPSPSSSARMRRNRRKSPCRHKCKMCNESSLVRIDPCCCNEICQNCLVDHLETNNTCPACNGRIDSCSPVVLPFGKCKNCGVFTKLVQVSPCNHSFCDSCFERRMKGNEKCPECGEQIQGIKQKQKTSTTGYCIICQKFKWLAKFQPCGHRAFCRMHAKHYLKISTNECNVCRSKVTAVD